MLRGKVLGLTIALGAAALAWATGGSAQEFPTRPIKLVVPLPAGGVGDVLARALGDQLTKRLGQPMVVENRVGAGGFIGSDVVAKAEPDGYTLLLGSNSLVGYPIFLKDAAKLDPVKAFTPLSLLTELPWIIVVNSSVPAKSLADFVSYVKANPKKLNFAVVSNSAQQLDMMRFIKMAGLDVVLINYNGTAPVYAALLANDVQAYFGAWAAIGPHAKPGRLTPLAVTSARRTEQAPAIPTAREAGMNFEASTWFALLGPAGMSPARSGRLAGETAAAIREDLAARIREIGHEVVGSTPEVLAQVIARDQALYKGIADSIGVKQE